MPQRQHPAKPAASGMTLVELAVTVSLIALCAALAGYALLDARGWLAHHRLGAATRELYYRMQSVRLYAIRDNHDWAIVFVPEENKYLICSDPGPDHSWSKTEDNRITETVDFSSYKGDVAYGAGGASVAVTGSSSFPSDWVSFNHNYVKFDPRGTASNSGYCYLANPEGESCSVGALTNGLVKMAFWRHGHWDD